MAVNENLYNWLIKTQGMGAAEWYRNNPTKPHTSNPFVPPNEAKWFPKADAGDPYRSQQIAQDPYRDQTYASAMPEYVEESVIEPASPDYFQQFLDSLSAQERQQISELGELTAQEKEDIGYDYAARKQLGELNPAQKKQVNNLITYDPNYGQYGGYLTKEDLGFSPTSVLYKRYEDAAGKIPLPSNPLSAEYDNAMAARTQAFKQNYQIPLEQLEYKKYTDAPSLEAYRSSLSKLGIDIPLLQNDFNYFVRAATADDPEVQEAGIYNVGLDRYRNERINEATQKNIEILKQQASEGVPDAQQYLREYSKEEVGPRGEEIGPRTGPRGEVLDDIAAVYGEGFPKTPGWMKQIEREYNKVKDKPFSPGNPKPGRGMADTWEGPVREAFAPKQDFDEQQARVASSAADKYRQKAKVEDPFRGGSFG